MKERGDDIEIAVLGVVKFRRFIFELGVKEDDGKKKKSKKEKYGDEFLKKKKKRRFLSKFKENIEEVI